MRFREINDENDKTIDLPAMNIDMLDSKGLAGIENLAPAAEKAGSNGFDPVQKVKSPARRSSLGSAPARKGLSPAPTASLPPAEDIIEAKGPDDVTDDLGPAGGIQLTEEELALVKEFNLDESTDAPGDGEAPAGVDSAAPKDDSAVSLSEFVSGEQSVVAKEDQSMDMSEQTMEMTVNVGQILEATATPADQSVDEDNVTMDFTKNVGEILAQSVGPTDDVKEAPAPAAAPADSEVTTASLDVSAMSEGSAMEMTRNVGEILSSTTEGVVPKVAGIELPVEEAPSAPVNVSTVSDGSNMEMTRNVGEILSAVPDAEVTESVGESKAIAPVSADESADISMDMTKNQGEILSLADAPDMAADNGNVDEVTMEMTENVGEIIDADESSPAVAEPGQSLTGESVDMTEATMELTQNFLDIVDCETKGAAADSTAEAEQSIGEGHEAPDLNESNMEFTKNLSEIVKSSDTQEFLNGGAKAKDGDDNTVQDLQKIMAGEAEDKTCDLPKHEALSDVTKNIEALFGEMMGDVPGSPGVAGPADESVTVELTTDAKVPGSADVSMMSQGKSFELGEAENFEMKHSLADTFFDRTGIRFPRVTKHRQSSFGTMSNWPPSNLSEMIEFSITGLVTEQKQDLVKTLSECVKEKFAEAVDWEDWLCTKKLPGVMEALKGASDEQVQALSKVLQEVYRVCRMKARLEFDSWEFESQKVMLRNLRHNHDALAEDRCKIYDILYQMEKAESESATISEIDAQKVEIAGQRDFILEMIADIAAKKTQMQAMRKQIVSANEEVRVAERRAESQRRAIESRQELQVGEKAAQASLYMLGVVTGVSGFTTGKLPSGDDAMSMTLLSNFAFNVTVRGGKTVGATLKCKPVVEAWEDESVSGLKADVLGALFNASQGAIQNVLEPFNNGLGMSEMTDAVNGVSVLLGRLADVAAEAVQLVEDDKFNVSVRTSGNQAFLRVRPTSSATVSKRAMIILDFPMSLEILAPRVVVISAGLNAAKHKLTTSEAVMQFAAKFSGFRRITRISRAINLELSQ